MGNENLYNEDLLLRQLCSGDEDAFSRIFSHYHPVLLQYAKTILKSDQFAEDVCSEVFESIWKNKESLSNIASLRHYLLTSIKNRSFNLLKSQLRNRTFTRRIAESFEDRSFSTEAHLLQKEYADFIRKNIDQLPSRSREVYLLCREEGYSYDEAATQLGISRNAIKNHMVYSMKRLKLSVEKAFGIFLLLLLILRG